ncbi:hypothetical protein AMTRI_Chr03g140640 [Amborella trichopoda]
MKFNTGLLLTFLPQFLYLWNHTLSYSLSPLKTLRLLGNTISALERKNPFAAFKKRNIGKRYRVDLDKAMSNRKCDKQVQVMKGQWA